MTRSAPRTQPLRHLVALWLAALAVGFGALAPAISHALVHGRGPTGLTVCTGSRITTIVLDAPDSTTTADSAGHCPYCLYPADRVVSAPFPLFRVLADERSAPSGAIGMGFLASLDGFVLPAPRGPPEFT